MLVQASTFFIFSDSLQLESIWLDLTLEFTPEDFSPLVGDKLVNFIAWSLGNLIAARRVGVSGAALGEVRGLDLAVSFSRVASPGLSSWGEMTVSREENEMELSAADLEALSKSFLLPSKDKGLNASKTCF